MEQFDGKAPRGVKEKSVYQLHLDTPRIIIISSVIIGVIIISVLVGMNLKKADGTDGDIAKKDGLELPLSNAEKELSMLANKVPGMGETPPAAKPGELSDKDKLFQKDPAGAIIPGGPAKPDGAAHPEKEAAPSGDILTKDNIKEIIPPVREASLDKPKKHKLAKEAKGKKKDGEPARMSAGTKEREKKAKKNKVVEVASKTKDADDPAPRRHGFMIQIGSYDNRTKADAEKARLEKMNYDAFVDKTMKNGKRYFRVRVGPIASKRNAINTLNDLQDNTRYRDSFMVKE